MEDMEMAVKKASAKDLAEKAAAAKKADAAKKAPEVKEEAKKTVAKVVEPVKKEAAKKAPAKKAEPAKKAAAPAAKKAEPAKKAAAPAAKKAPAKKAATAKTQLFVQYQGGNVSTEDLVKKAIEVSGKKSVKELNLYYQPENYIVYFTADGEEGSFNL